MTKEEQSVALQSAARLATAMQTGIFTGRTQLVYSYGCYGYTRGGGAPWHGGLDLVGMDDAFIRMPPYMGKKAIQGTVTRAGIVTDHNAKTWEWGWYICVPLDAGQTPDEVNFLYFCHCKELLVKVGQKVKTGDILGIMGQTGNAAGGYDHCHLEVRATATGIGLDPTAYSGTDNAVGIYGTKPFPPGMMRRRGARARLCYSPPGGLVFAVGNGASCPKRQKCGQKCGQMCGITGRSSAPAGTRR